MRIRWWILFAMVSIPFIAWTLGWYNEDPRIDPKTGVHNDSATRAASVVADLIFWAIGAMIIVGVIMRLLGDDSRIRRFPVTVREWASRHPYAATVLGLWLLLVLLILINQKLAHHGDGMGSTWSGAITITAITLAIMIPITHWIDRRHERVWAPQPGPERQASYCPNCGSRLISGQRFCAECGAPAGVVRPSGGP